MGKDRIDELLKYLESTDWKCVGETPKFIPPCYHPNEHCKKIMDLWIDNGMIG